MKGGLGAPHRGPFGANQSRAWLPIASGFRQSLVSSRRASRQIGQLAYTEEVGELVQAVAGGSEDAAEEQSPTKFASRAHRTIAILRRSTPLQSDPRRIK
jgi:hypothetical protein